MADGVFLERDGDLVAMSATVYDAESQLQELVARYPGLLAGQTDDGSPCQWLLVMREQGLAATEGGANQWSVDHLFVDQAGVPTIVEVKRASDTRIRREVVGQVLDYAANGVRYWSAERLRADLAARLGGMEAADEAVVDLQHRAGRQASVDDFWTSVEDNLRAGRLRLLFVADAIPETLRRIIEFLNEQMTQCEVLGVEVRQYQAGEHRVFSPTVYGRTTQSLRTKRQAVAPGTFEEVLASAAPDAREAEGRLELLASQQGWIVRTTPAARHYHLPDGRLLMRLYPGDGDGHFEFFLSALHDTGH
ncbi:MAG: hypothetical protein B7X41_15815, partial [Microbacterium sp. 14-71-5]